MTTIYLEQWVLDAMADKDHPPIGGAVRAYVHAAPGAGRVAFVPADVATVVQADPGALIRMQARSALALLRAVCGHDSFSVEDCEHCAAADGVEALLRAAAPAPAVGAPADPLRESLQQKCCDLNVYWRASDAHGVAIDVEQARELLADALGVEVEIAAPAPAAVQPVPADPLYDGLSLDQVKDRLSALCADDLRGLVVSLLIQQRIAERAFAGTQPVPAGYWLAPDEPNAAMCVAGAAREGAAVNAYCAMRAAHLAQQPAATEQGQHDAPPPMAWSSDAARDVLAERRRQVEVEGWTPEHDDEHDCCQLAEAAAAYAYNANVGRIVFASTPPAAWPWAAEWWKPGDQRRMLVKAGALILADIARCPGAVAIYDDGSMREGCDDCQRRTCPPVDPERVLMMAPPAIIAFECEWRIAHSDGAKP